MKAKLLRMLFWGLVLLPIALHAQNNGGVLRQKAEALKTIRQLSRKQVMQIANYESLTRQQKEHYRKRIEYWLTRIYKTSGNAGSVEIPEGVKNLYPGVVHIEEKHNTINMIDKWNIAYIPDLNLYYLIYLKYYEAFDEYGHNTPLPEIVMGIMNVESHYRWVKGDNNQSIGPCQLNKPTARWLLEKESTRDIFRHFIYFDKANLQGDHHFYNQEAMVEFMYEFLIRIKGYGRGSELNAIAGYNGSSLWAKYSTLVKKAAASYLAYKSHFQNTANSPGDLAYKKVQQIRQNYIDRMFPRDKKGVPYLAYHYATGKQASSVEPAKVKQRTNLLPGSRFTSKNNEAGQAIYLTKKKGRSLFSYFRGNLAQAAFYHNKIMSRVKQEKPDYREPLGNDFIYLYYYKGGTSQKHFIRSVQAYKQAAANYSIQTNFSDGKIYLDPAIPVYYPDDEPVCKLETLR